uniref:Ubiquitin-like domain-containing protein n=2 Tax=Auxenochlorella protothecoides TaxID=3075 RepID=A0A1D2A1G5_AUXPR
MEVSVRFGSSAHIVSLPAEGTLGDLRAGVEAATGVLARQQKLLCRGKVLAEPGAGRDDTRLSSMGLVAGTKLMLLAATGPGPRRAVGRPAERPSQRANVAASPGLDPRPASAGMVSGFPVTQAQIRVWKATGIASLGAGPGAPTLDGWPPALLEAAPGLRVLSCHGALSPLANPFSAPLAPFCALQRLSLTGCGLPSAALDWRALGALRALAKLSLRGNALRALPCAVGDLLALRELDVACNLLESLPGAAMAGWTTLTLLDVSHNQLRCLPGEVGACASLETLLAGNNRLAVIPAQVSALQLLKTLNLDCNRIQAVPPAVLRDCGALRTLSLHDNPITVEELRNTEGWAAHDARRRQKHDKQLGSEVLGPGMDEGADAHPVQNWK